MSGRARLAAAVLAVLLVLAGGGLAYFALVGSEDGGSADGSTGGDDQPFTAPADGSLGEVASSLIRVEASSFLQPVDGITYGPENTVDGDLQTAWNTARAADEGRGQSITFRFTEPVDVRALRFVNGYAKNDDIYQANHRIRDVVIIADGHSQRVSLLDTKNRQEIEFEFGLTSKVTLRIEDVYTGTGFNDPELSADLALTEVAFVAVQP